MVTQKTRPQNSHDMIWKLRSQVCENLSRKFSRFAKFKGLFYIRWKYKFLTAGTKHYLTTGYHSVHGLAILADTICSKGHMDKYVPMNCENVNFVHVATSSLLWTLKTQLSAFLEVWFSRQAWGWIIAQTVIFYDSGAVPKKAIFSKEIW